METKFKKTLRIVIENEPISTTEVAEILECSHAQAHMSLASWQNFGKLRRFKRIYKPTGMIRTFWELKPSARRYYEDHPPTG